jgi:hypothetical protein
MKISHYFKKSDSNNQCGRSIGKRFNPENTIQRA